MGEIAEMILDGILDEQTGEYLGGAVGYPRTRNKKSTFYQRTQINYFKSDYLPHIQKLYDVVEFNPNSFRIKGEGFTIDYYPKSQKVFNHSDKLWYTNIQSPLKFINKYIKKEQENKAVKPPFDANDL